MDTSALTAILLDEPEAAGCMDALSTADALSMSSVLRDRINAHVSSGHSRPDSLRPLGVRASCAMKVVQHLAKTGSAAPPRHGRPPAGGKLAPQMGKLVPWVKAQPDITMAELAARLEAETKVLGHPASLSRVLIGAELR